jgi:predicted ATP-grasp superfamily ATP-dependent carboligase
MDQTSQMELSLQIEPGTMAAPPRPQRVLIGFAEALAAIESAWSLDEAGFEVLAFARRGSRPPLRRSDAVALHELTPPELDAAAAQADLRALIESAGVDAVMPLDDIALRLCQEPCREAGVTLIGPSGRQAEVALDKRLQIEAARAAGLAVPATTFLDGGPVPTDLTFPLVVRPAGAIAESAGHLGTAAGATTCADRGELDRRLASREEGEVLMAQPQLRGSNEGLFGVMTPAGARAWSGHRRLRMMNPAGSGSSACESTVPDPDFCDQVGEMLEAIGWRGLFMVELLRDEEGTPWFIELNGRAWGSMALARAGGLEYPAWAARLALGDNLGELLAPKAVGGRRARHLGRELKHAAIVMRGSHSAAVPWPSRTRTLRDVFTFRRGDRFYNWSGRRADLPLLLDDTAATLRRRKRAKGPGG